jgi:flagellar biogenesis protein FliO
MSLADDLTLLARVTGGLFVVLVVVAIVARLARRARGVGKGEYLRVVERVPLSREAYVAVVQAGGRSLLIGVTPQGIGLLAPLDVPPGQQPVHVVLETARPPGGGRDRTPPTATPAAGSPSRRDLAMPAGVDMTGHPDLASALRAAGRTAGEDGEPGQAGQAGGRAAAEPGALPRRADVRRGRAAVPQQRQASGSVLSPRTWRQGIDALRDATVRRG